jgi:hypothetical protein
MPHAGIQFSFSQRSRSAGFGFAGLSAGWRIGLSLLSQNSKPTIVNSCPYICIFVKTIIPAG